MKGDLNGDRRTGDGLLVMTGVSKVFGKGVKVTTAVDRVTLTAGQGEMVALMGRSGCGKSTLLRLAAGLETPDSGSVLYDGRPVTGPSKDRAVVFQEHRLMPWLTVAGNVRLGRDISDEEVDALLEFADLSGMSSKYPSQLSGGMAQRVSVLRAMAGKPRLMLMDEPFGALDYHTRTAIQARFARWRRKTNTTVILVTHDLDEAMYLCDRFAILSPNGRLAADVSNSVTSAADGTRVRDDGSIHGIKAKLRELLAAEGLDISANPN